MNDYPRHSRPSGGARPAVYTPAPPRPPLLQGRPPRQAPVYRPFQAGPGNGGGHRAHAHRAHLALAAYLLAVLAATLIHLPGILAGMLLVVLALAGRRAPAILGRALKSILFFNLVISGGYLFSAWQEGVSPWPTLLLLNLRVLLITTLSFLFMARVNLFLALGSSRRLAYLLGLAYSQALTFRRAHADFSLALASRSPRRPRLMDRYRASAAAASWFLDKGLAASRDAAQALRSRGFFDDPRH